MAEEPPRGSYAIKYVCKVCMYVLCVFFAGDFVVGIDEILLKRNSFHLNMLLLFLRRLRNRSE